MTIGGMDFGYRGPDANAEMLYLIEPSAQPEYVSEAAFKPILYIGREAVKPNVLCNELCKMAKAVGPRTEILCDNANPLMIDAMNASGDISARGAPTGAGCCGQGCAKCRRATSLSHTTALLVLTR